MGPTAVSGAALRTRATSVSLSDGFTTKLPSTHTRRGREGRWDKLQVGTHIYIQLCDGVSRRILHGHMQIDTCV